jgi:hypothetical protein
VFPVASCLEGLVPLTAPASDLPGLAIFSKLAELYGLPEGVTLALLVLFSALAPLVEGFSVACPAEVLSAGDVLPDADGTCFSASAAERISPVLPGEVFSTSEIFALGESVRPEAALFLVASAVAPDD